MSRFPADAPLISVISTLEVLSFRVVRRGNHIAMVRDNLDGTRTPLTMPNHRTIKASTLRTRPPEPKATGSNLVGDASLRSRFRRRPPP
jgi:hypothetical protein